MLIEEKKTINPPPLPILPTPTPTTPLSRVPQIKSIAEPSTRASVDKFIRLPLHLRRSYGNLSPVVYRSRASPRDNAPTGRVATVNPIFGITPIPTHCIAFVHACACVFSLRIRRRFLNYARLRCCTMCRYAGARKNPSRCRNVTFFHFLRAARSLLMLIIVVYTFRVRAWGERIECRVPR